MAEYIEIKTVSPTISNKHNVSGTIPKATEKQILLLNKLYDENKISQKAFMSALESKRFASKMINQGMHSSPIYKLGYR